VTDEVADWSGDWIVNEIAARVDRAGPRPVSEDHEPGLVHPPTFAAMVCSLYEKLTPAVSAFDPGNLRSRHPLIWVWNQGSANLKFCRNLRAVH
jgi:hypothetical protein